MTDIWPSITAVIPTLNAARHLDACLASLRQQTYAGSVEVLIIDAGSTDTTLEIARRHKVDRILPNPLRSGEAGKAVGVKAAGGELILLVDSDNTLIGSDWLSRIVRPFIEDAAVMGCEPARFAHVPEDHYINRWHALIGAADPLTVYLGNYSRESVITGTWTGYPHHSEAHDRWEAVDLDPQWVPVFGANGFMMRKRAYELAPVGDYLFDLDHVFDLVQAGHRRFARVDVAVHHAFCDGVSKYWTKTRRRIDDLFFFAAEGRRSYPWTTGRRMRRMMLFGLSTLFTLPVIVTAIRGHLRKPDAGAWAWHPLACWITLIVYAAGVVRGRLRPRMLDRTGWRQ